MKNKKSRFWTVVFSFCPGAGHLYMGFMKMGLSFLLGFMISIALVNLTGLDVLAVFSVVIYIYAFFHANNIASLNDERFYALEDKYLLGLEGIGETRFKLNQKTRSIAAVALILIGICMLGKIGFGMIWEYVGYDNPIMKLIFYTVRNVVPRVLMAIAVIWFGIVLLRGKKLPFEDENAQEPVMKIEESVKNAGNGQSEQNVTNTENRQEREE